MGTGSDSSLVSQTDSAMAPQFINWTEDHVRKYASQSFLASHPMHELELFSDESIVELLDTYPRDRLQIFTMGADPEIRSEWQPVDTRDASGKDIMHAVSVGRLWVKLMRADLASPDYQELTHRLMREFRDRYPSIDALSLRPLLLISSPGALVYYHADAQNMLLWQIRGSKRIWIYPGGEPYLQPEMMEEIFSGDADEEVPYELAFDESAVVYDVNPGEVLSWPLNAPHRVTNHDSVNVSLSVSVGTELADKRSQLYQANLFLRRNFGFKKLSVREEGFLSFCKRTGFRVVRKLGISPAPSAHREPYMASVRIDGNSATGLSPVPGQPVRTLF